MRLMRNELNDEIQQAGKPPRFSSPYISASSLAKGQKPEARCAFLTLASPLADRILAPHSTEA